MRLDQWLWAVRIYKTRNAAAKAIREGEVRVNGGAPKAAHEVREGEEVAVMERGTVRTWQVLGTPRARVGAKLVSEYAQIFGSDIEGPAAGGVSS